MGFEAGSIMGRMQMDGSQTINTFRKVEAEAKLMKQGVIKSADAAATGMDRTFTSSLLNLKKKFGEESGLGLGMKLLMGSGAIAGIGLAARGFEALGTKVEETAAAMRKGNMSWREIAGDVARALPVIGEAVKGFDHLRDAITGILPISGLQLDMEDTFGKLQAEGDALRTKVIDEGKHHIIEWQKEAEKLQQTLDELRAPKEALDGLRGKHDSENRMGALKEKYEQDAGFSDGKGGEGVLIKTQREFAQAKAEQERLRQLTVDRNEAIRIRDSGTNDPQQIARFKAIATQLAAAGDLESAFDEASARYRQLSEDLKVLNTAANDAAAGFDKARKTTLELEGERLRQGRDKLNDSLMQGPGFGEGAGVKMKEVLGGELLGEALQSLADMREPASSHWEKLPNSGVNAQEVFGRRTVTEADLPQRSIQVQDEVKKENQKQTQLLERILRAIAQPSGPGLGGDVDIVTLEGGS